MEEKDSILEDIKVEEVEAPYIQRMFINIIDGIMGVVIMVAIYFLLPNELITKLFAITPFIRYFIILIVVFSYRLICILLMGKTIGMIICRSKYLNNNLLPLSQKERLIAVFAAKQSGIKYYKV